MNWPIGLSTGCFYHTGILGILEPVREAGFRLLEICSFPRHLDYHDIRLVREVARRIRDLDLVAASLHAPFADHIDITSLDREEREASVSEILRAAEAAALLGVRYLVIHPGPEREAAPPKMERYQRLEHGVESLTRVNDACRENGITLLLENMLPHLMFGPISDLLFILGGIKATDVGACLDTGDAFLSGDLLTVADKLSGLLVLVHANDNRGDWDDHLPPGDGLIPWKDLLERLQGGRFEGTIILELAGDENRSGADILEGARRGRQLLEHLQDSLRKRW